MVAAAHPRIHLHLRHPVKRPLPGINNRDSGGGAGGEQLGVGVGGDDLLQGHGMMKMSLILKLS